MLLLDIPPGLIGTLPPLEQPKENVLVPLENSMLELLEVLGIVVLLEQLLPLTLAQLINGTKKPELTIIV